MKSLLIIIFTLSTFSIYAQTTYWVYKVSEISVNPSSKKMKSVEVDVDIELTMDGKYIEVDNHSYIVDQSTLKVSDDNTSLLLSFDSVDEKSMPCKIILGNNRQSGEFYIRIVRVSNIIEYYYK